MNEQQLAALSYKKLQTLATAYAVPGNVKKNVMIKLIMAAKHGKYSEVNHILQAIQPFRKKKFKEIHGKTREMKLAKFKAAVIKHKKSSPESSEVQQWDVHQPIQTNTYNNVNLSNTQSVANAEKYPQQQQQQQQQSYSMNIRQSIQLESNANNIHLNYLNTYETSANQSCEASDILKQMLQSPADINLNQISNNLSNSNYNIYDINSIQKNGYTNEDDSDTITANSEDDDDVNIYSTNYYNYTMTNVQNSKQVPYDYCNSANQNQMLYNNNYNYAHSNNSQRQMINNNHQQRQMIYNNQQMYSNNVHENHYAFNNNNCNNTINVNQQSTTLYNNYMTANNQLAPTNSCQQIYQQNNYMLNNSSSSLTSSTSSASINYDNTKFNSVSNFYSTTEVNCNDQQNQNQLINAFGPEDTILPDDFQLFEPDQILPDLNNFSNNDYQNEFNLPVDNLIESPPKSETAVTTNNVLNEHYWPTQCSTNYSAQQLLENILNIRTSTPMNPVKTEHTSTVYCYPKPLVSPKMSIEKQNAINHQRKKNIQQARLKLSTTY